jgi:hypothetical protein
MRVWEIVAKPWSPVVSFLKSDNFFNLLKSDRGSYVCRFLDYFFEYTKSDAEPDELALERSNPSERSQGENHNQQRGAELVYQDLEHVRLLFNGRESEPYLLERLEHGFAQNHQNRAPLQLDLS